MKVRNYFPVLVGCLLGIIFLWLICGAQLNGYSLHVYLMHGVFLVATLVFFILALVVFTAFKEELLSDLELERKNKAEILAHKTNKRKKGFGNDQKEQTINPS